MSGLRMPAGACDCGMFEIGKTISYRGRRHVVVGVTPMGVTPCLVELEDTESGCVRSVQCDDPDIVIDRAEALPNASESPELEV
jgi:hypothetical protein